MASFPRTRDGRRVSMNLSFAARKTSPLPPVKSAFGFSFQLSALQLLSLASGIDLCAFRVFVVKTLDSSFSVSAFQRVSFCP